MNVTRELVDLAERLADNAHQIWAKQKMEELTEIGKFATFLLSSGPNGLLASFCFICSLVVYWNKLSFPTNYYSLGFQRPIGLILCFCFFHLGGGVHQLLVPYDILTDRERKRYRRLTHELIRYLQYWGYRLSCKSKHQPDAAAPATNNYSPADKNTPVQTNTLQLAGERGAGMICRSCFCSLTNRSRPSVNQSQLSWTLLAQPNDSKPSLNN